MQMQSLQEALLTYSRLSGERIDVEHLRVQEPMKIVISLWRQAGGLSPVLVTQSPKFMHTCRDLGFTKQSKRSFKYAGFGGSTLPALFKRANFLEALSPHTG